MSSNNKSFSILTGGGADTLDAFAVAGLATDDFAFGIVNGLQHAYSYDASLSKAATDSPYFIVPVDNASGTGAWVLGGFQGAISHVKAVSNSGQSIGTGAFEDIVFEDEERDFLSEYDHTTGIFTAAYTGTRIITAGIAFTDTAWTIGRVLMLLANTNASESNIRLERFIIPQTASLLYHIKGAASFYLATGETLTMQGFQNSGGPIALESGNEEYNYFTIDGSI